MSENYHGLLLADKPKGWTSHDLVDHVRGVFETRSVGHCGTLDPIASGLMVLLIGEATKLSNYILEKDKAYRTRAQLGVVTDTLDTTGEVREKQTVDLSQEKMREAVIGLQGEMTLPVPMYSAVKVDGTRLHHYARKGESVEQPQKLMRFSDFQNLEFGTDWLQVEMQCSKGSYVRAWVHELGQKLGCGAAMSALVRTESWPYRLDQAQTIEQIAAKKQSGELLSTLIPMASALPDYKLLRVSGLDQTLLLNGQISHALKAQLISVFKPGIDVGAKVISQSEGKLLALLGLEPGKGFIIRRIFRY